MNLHEDLPNLYTKIAEDECKAKGNTIISLLSLNIKEALNGNNVDDLVSFIEEKGKFILKQ